MIILQVIFLVIQITAFILQINNIGNPITNILAIGMLIPILIAGSIGRSYNE